MDVEGIFPRFAANPLLAGITFSGGEPFLQPEPLSLLARKVRGLGKSVFIYSGYTLEELSALARSRPGVAELLRLADTLIDGPYIEKLQDLNLPFRGSSNQREISRPEILRALF